MPTRSDIVSDTPLLLCGSCEKVYWGARWEELRLENAEARKNKKQYEEVSQAKNQLVNEIADWLITMEHRGIAQEIIKQFIK